MIPRELSEVGEPCNLASSSSMLGSEDRSLMVREFKAPYSTQKGQEPFFS